MLRLLAGAVVPFVVVSADLFELLRAGGRCQIRRPVLPGEDDCPLQPGRVYPVCLRCTGPALTRARAVRITRSTLDDITDEDLALEGFATREQLLATWRAAHGHADLAGPVWVVLFELETQLPPRYLAQGLGYTSDARRRFRGEPEAVDAETQDWQTFRRHRAHEDRMAARRAERRRRSLEQRLADINRRAAAAKRTHGYDASKHLRVMERRLARLEADLDDLRVA